MVQNCLKAHTLLAKLGVEVTVADARFCKPLDIKLLRQLCKHHSFLITVEEGSIGGFGSHVAQFIALDGLLDRRIKVKLTIRKLLSLLYPFEFLGGNIFLWIHDLYRFIAPKLYLWEDNLSECWHIRLMCVHMQVAWLGFPFIQHIVYLILF